MTFLTIAVAAALLGSEALVHVSTSNSLSGADVRLLSDNIFGYMAG